MLKVKKMFTALMLGLSLALSSQMFDTNTAAAQDVWAYSFKDGGSIYVMSETIWHEKYRGYHVTIKDIDWNGECGKVKLFFAQGEGGWWYKDERAGRTAPMTKVSGDPKMEAIIKVVLQYAK
ncbi:hypothetical protein SELR_pSRC102160 (plasmid) [Selenomonas ruminantium subsp. lactilytica TAM6421]|uniref:Uncharacterized protein n=1 Tax=Selenomonas ruminantium subsp. lactilytica (strain NBRC 103574 / TAM6421) TaxID=927704 RepID=I0GW86_SELRL|nr:hypothetical protein [Selenomonas ruminantium]BAL85023.1 hypothetical protein SELR_pSRC102160 [Selenomonas ruminantium subsp. lactilytica TAM6421]